MRQQLSLLEPGLVPLQHAA